MKNGSESGAPQVVTLVHQLPIHLVDVMPVLCIIGLGSQVIVDFLSATIRFSFFSATVRF